MIDLAESPHLFRVKDKTMTYLSKWMSEREVPMVLPVILGTCRSQAF